jgi:hypothetical protein
MANAKLYIICGNCGCNDMFKFKVHEKDHDITEKKITNDPLVFIKCKNCSTLHNLEDNAILEV